MSRPPSAIVLAAVVAARPAAPAPGPAAARPDPEITARLVQACARHLVVRVSYRSEAGNEWTTEADPWAIVVRYGRWYLLCHSHTARARRAYRIDRVTAVDILDLPFRPPATLDPVAVLDEHLATGWEYRTEILIAAPPQEAAAMIGPALGALRPGPDPGTTLLTGSTSSPHWYARQLPAVPVPYRILGGPELRDAARRIAERLLEATRPESELPTDAGPPPGG